METLILRPNSDDTISWHAKDIALPIWEASHAYILNNIVAETDVLPTHRATYYFICTQAGTSGGTEPSWDFTEGHTTNDNTVIWTSLGKVPHFDKVNEAVANGTDNYTYVDQFNFFSDRFNFEPHTIETEHIYKVTLYLTVKYWEASYTDLYLAINPTRTPPDVSKFYNMTPTINWVESSFDYTINPTTGLPWTWTDIDSILVHFYGCSTMLTQCYIIVSYGRKRHIYTIF